MKKRLLFLLLLIIVIRDIEAQFFVRIPGSQYVVAATPDKIFSSGFSFYSSTNNGNSWVMNQPQNTFLFLFPVNDDILYGGQYGQLNKSLNGGKTWKPCSTVNSIQALYFFDQNKGILAGGTIPGLLLRTVDGGNTFQNITLPPGTKTLYTIIFKDTLYGFAAGNSGTFIKTTDGGLTWNTGTTVGTAKINSIYFLDTLKGWAAGNTSYLGKTEDGGLTWLIDSLSWNGQSLKSVKFFDSKNGMVCGDSSLFKTSDGGQNWAELKGLSGKIFTSAVFVNADNAWIASSSLIGFDAKLPHLVITSPIESSTYYNGDTITVKWSYSLIASTTLSIYLSTNSGKDWTLAGQNIPIENCLYQFPCPTTNSNCKIKIFTESSPVIEAVSDIDFFIRLKWIMAGNEIKQYLQNDGMSSINSSGAGSAGLLWPGGVNAVNSVVYADGILFSGYANGLLKAGGSNYRTGLQPGNIISKDLAANPFDPKFNLWKLKKNWESLPVGTERDAYQYNYEHWPMDIGAPYVDVNHNGVYDSAVDIPKFIGDETIWYVANDLDSSKTKYLYGTQPIGIEMQVTEFAVNSPELKDVLFKKVKLFNKSSSTVSNMYMSVWSDPDLGDGYDDYVGCDTTLNLGYVYNGKASDAIFGAPPPAVGYYVFQGPVIPYDWVKYPVILQRNLPDSAYFENKWIKGKTNLPMSAFIFYINGSSVYKDATLGGPNCNAIYNNMNGKSWDGSPLFDPNIGNLPVSFCLPGDPVKGTGWYEGAGWPGGQAPGDRRMLMSFGPFDFAPNTSQELNYAVCIAKGTSNINSITAMKNLVSVVKKFNSGTMTDVNNPVNAASINFDLKQNYPNPFNPNTIINYAIPERGNVKLSIFNSLGQKITELVNEEKPAGNYSVKFNASMLPSGVYFYTLKVGGFIETRKLMLLK